MEKKSVLIPPHTQELFKFRFSHCLCDPRQPDNLFEPVSSFKKSNQCYFCLLLTSLINSAVKYFSYLLAVLLCKSSFYFLGGCDRVFSYWLVIGLYALRVLTPCPSCAMMLSFSFFLCPSFNFFFFMDLNF